MILLRNKMVLLSIITGLSVVVSLPVYASEASSSGFSEGSSAVAGAAANESREICVICREDLDLSPESLTPGGRQIKLACGHVLHRLCLAPWLERDARCPVCREIVQLGEVFSLARIFAPLRGFELDWETDRFADVFRNMCVQIVHDKNPQESIRWLGTIDVYNLCYLDEAWQEIVRLRRAMPTELIVREPQQLSWIRFGIGYLKERRDMLLKVLAAIDVAHEDSPFLHDVHLLQEAVEAEVYESSCAARLKRAAWRLITGVRKVFGWFHR